jgi:hypothetical protein
MFHFIVKAALESGTQKKLDWSLAQISRPTVVYRIINSSAVGWDPCKLEK